MGNATIKSGFLRRFLEFAESRGASRRDLMNRAGIGSEELEKRDDRIALSKYVAAMRAAKDLCGDPALALHFGEEVDMVEFSLIGMMGGTPSSLDEAFAQLNRHALLDVDFDLPGDRFRADDIDGDLWFIDQRPAPNDFPEFTESFFARVVSTMRRSLKGVELVQAVEVAHAEPPYRAEYDRIFQVPVRFGSARNALRIAAAIRDSLRNRARPTYAAEVLRTYADAEVEKLHRNKTVRGRLETLLTATLRSGDISMQAVASQLGVSRQTLFRKLKSEGTTFEKVLDELRYKLAVQYLEDAKLPVNEVAYLVGFSDPAAFSRAFKRWTGSRPGEARDRRRRP
jgi:AraC-like DNA-binding protein